MYSNAVIFHAPYYLPSLHYYHRTMQPMQLQNSSSAAPRVPCRRIHTGVPIYKTLEQYPAQSSPSARSKRFQRSSIASENLLKNHS